MESPLNVHPYIRILGDALLLYFWPNIENHIVYIKEYRSTVEVYLLVFNFSTNFIAVRKKYERKVTRDKLMKIGSK